MNRIQMALTGQVPRRMNGSQSHTNVLGEKGGGKKNDEGTFENSLLGVLALKMF